MIVMITVIIAVLFVLPVVIYNMARADKQFTFLKTGEIKFIVSGETFARLIMDVSGFSYDESKDEIIEKIGPLSGNWFRRLLRSSRFPVLQAFAGVHYVSIFYPYMRIWDWVFEWDKQTREADKTDTSPQASIVESGSAQAYRVVHRKEWVDSLFFEFTYPVRPRNLELKGGGSANVNSRFIVQIVKPRYLVFTLNGAWYPAMINSLEARIADFAKQMSIEDMYDLSKMSSDSFNAWFSKDPLILLGAIRIKEAIFEGFDLAGSEEARKALEEQRISQIQIKTEKNRGFANAKRVHEEARGKAAAILLEGEAVAKSARLLGDALGHQREKLGDDLMGRKLQADTVGGFRGAALSLGGGGHQVLVTADNEQKGGKS